MSASTPEEIAQNLWIAIAEQRLRPGTRLKEAELAEIFAASRARVRQALVQLEQEGMVEILPNKGASVAAPTPEEARDVFHLRRAVEERVIERLLSHLDARKIDRIARHISLERRAAAQGNRRATIRLSGGFHLLLAELAEAEFLVSTLRQLVSRSSLITAAFGDNRPPDCGPDEHALILEHLKAGREAEAQAALRHHLEHVEAHLNLTSATPITRSLREILGKV